MFSLIFLSLAGYLAYNNYKPVINNFDYSLIDNNNLKDGIQYYVNIGKIRLLHSFSGNFLISRETYRNFTDFFGIGIKNCHDGQGDYMEKVQVNLIKNQIMSMIENFFNCRPDKNLSIYYQEFYHGRSKIYIKIIFIRKSDYIYSAEYMCYNIISN